MRRRPLLASLGALAAGACWPFGRGSPDAPPTPDPTLTSPPLPTFAPPPASTPTPAPVVNTFGTVDASTAARKLLFGYQGWFSTPDDGSRFNGWVHWSEPWERKPSPTTVRVDMWPDLTEFDPDELTATDLRTRDGRVVYVYSSYRRKSVFRHFRWMGENGIDGVMSQRFITSPWDPRARDFRDEVARHVRAGAEAYGRVFAVEYDLSSWRGTALLDDLQQDWTHLVDDLRLLDSDRYLRHGGRPLLGVWGIGFSHIRASVDDVKALIRWFTVDAPPRLRVALLGGVPSEWRQSYGPASRDTRWPATLMECDLVSPWYVGAVQSSDADVERFRRDIVAPDVAACRSSGRELMPVVFPGFSWQNQMAKQGRVERINAYPRRGGSFWWKQVYEYLGAGATTFKGAMFDEIDEGTAMYKLVSKSVDAPETPSFVTLDADGLELPSDWYLRLAGAGTKMLRGEIALAPTIPIRP